MISLSLSMTWPSYTPSPRPHDCKSRGKENEVLTLPLRFPSLVFSGPFSRHLPHRPEPRKCAFQKLCPYTQPDNPTVASLTIGASQPHPLPVSCAGGGEGGRLAPLTLLPSSLLPSPWAQLASDSGPLKSLLQPTGLGPGPAPPALGLPTESSPLLPED